MTSRAKLRYQPDQRSRKPRSKLMLLVVALVAGSLSLIGASPAAAAADFVCTIEADGADAALSFSGDQVGTTANLRDQDGWVATVTGQATYVDAGGADGSYIVKLNSLGETVSCTPPPPPPPLGDFACEKTRVGDDAVLTFTGQRGASENLRRNGSWAGTTTGVAERTVSGGAEDSFSVRIRGNGYSGPNGYAVVDCVEPPCETSAILVLCEGALLGSSADFTDSNGNSIDKITDYRAIEAKIGRQYDIFHDFLRPSDWTRIADDGFPYRSGMQDLVDEGRVMFVNWKNPAGPNEWASMLTGSQDMVIDQTAQAIADFGEPVFFSFYHEPENNIEPAAAGSAARELELIEDYGNTFRYIHDRFDAVGADNVIWVWDIMGFSKFWPYYDAGLYPGDDVVDWIAYNQYNWYQCHNTNNWKTFSEVMSPFYGWLEEGGPGRPSLDKPVMIGEFSTEENVGAANSNQTKGEWYESIPATLETEFPRIKALVAFDTEGRKPNGDVQFCEWSVESTPEALAGWTAMANSQYLNNFQ